MRHNQLNINGRVVSRIHPVGYRNKSKLALAELATPFIARAQLVSPTHPESDNGSVNIVDKARHKKRPSI
jgi:hypothetical protein